MLSFIQMGLLGLSIGQAVGTVHHIFSGVFSGADLYAIEFDDEALTLTLANTIPALGTSSKWIAMDERKQNIYVANKAQYDSYTIINSTSLGYKSTVTLPSTCDNTNFIVASSKSPYHVFAAPYNTGCAGQMMSVDASGALSGIIANISYGSTAAVHGMALSTDNQFLYSAGSIGNGVWSHSVNSSAEEVTEIQYLPAPTGANPRHIAVHPLGAFAYAVFEETNQIGVYARDAITGNLTYTNTTYSTIPSSFNTSDFWSDEVQFSVSSSGAPKYMYASTRAWNTSTSGYVTGFSLDASTGAVVNQLFITPTTGSGGGSNAITAAPFAEEYFSITDSGSNFMEIWKITMNGTESATAAAIAHLDTAGGPSTGVWYD